MTTLLHSELTEIIIGAFYQVHHELGFGFLESVYSAALGCMFLDLGVPFEREVPSAVYFRGLRIGRFRADMIVDRRVLIEIKASSVLDPNAEAQLINYLRATDLELGLLLHFGQKPGFRRLVFANSRKHRP